MTDKLYAKSRPPESITEHTKNLLAAYVFLKKHDYLNSDFFSEYEFVICKMLTYHDYGKINTFFQNRIRRALQLPLLKNDHLDGLDEIPHEWLSLAFIGREDKKEFRKYNTGNVRMLKVVQYAIAFHHSRNEQREYALDGLKEMIELDIEKLKHYLNIDYELSKTYSIQDIRKKVLDFFDDYFEHLVFFKGLLHKCDYAASAHIMPESVFNGNYRKIFETWQISRFELRPFQRQAVKFPGKSLILVASTGMGKTEFSMNWLTGKKGFYLLGIRIAVNEMYKRFSKIFGQENVGLLHGDAAFSLFERITEDKERNDQNLTAEYYDRLTRARQMSYPLMVATVDQLVPAVFKFNGFEWVYFTVSYAQIIVDEIQSFAPEALAAVIVFLKEIHCLGCRFLVMTATLPPFIARELTGLNDVIRLPDALTTLKRHHIQTYDFSIKRPEAADLIRREVESGKKVLVICNTVRRSQTLFESLANLKPKLLHSHFIQRDRKNKEQKIMDDAGGEKNTPVVWIATQLVEASLDIDFDILFTECSTVDSLFQRFGRCWRKRQEDYTSLESNIHIFKVDKNYIYDNILLTRSWQVIQGYNHRLISEYDKQDMIKQVFKNIESTAYGQKYRKMKELLENGYKAGSRNEAQKKFREIIDNFFVIPQSIFKKNQNEIKEIIEILDGGKLLGGLELIEYRKRLLGFTLLIQLRGKKKELLKILNPFSPFCRKYQLFLLNGVEYNYETGLSFIKEYRNDDNII